jgi:manganese/zinc/iron transport system permease protein
LVIPPATAHLITNQFVPMLVWTFVLGFLSALLGYYMSDALNSSIAGSMAVASGFLFVLAMFFGPQRGLLVKFFRSRKIAPHRPF